MSETITGKTDTPVTIDNIEQASTNFFWTYETQAGQFSLQTTIRGVLSYPQIQAHIKSALEATAHIAEIGGIAKQIGKGNDSQPASELPIPTMTDKIISEVVANDPTLIPQESKAVAPSGSTFKTEKLEVTSRDGKNYFKVKGGMWKKYGVTVWDEVLVAAGIPVGKLEAKEYNLDGFMATVAFKDDGKPQKVVKLEKTE